MDSIQFVDELHPLNYSTIISVYGGRIYYADLYSSNSYILEFILGLIALSGILSNCILLFLHIGAIIYGRYHLYKTCYTNDVYRSKTVKCAALMNIDHKTNTNPTTTNTDSNVNIDYKIYSIIQRCHPRRLCSVCLLPFNKISRSIICVHKSICNSNSHTNSSSSRNVTNNNGSITIDATTITTQLSSPGLKTINADTVHNKTSTNIFTANACVNNKYSLSTPSDNDITNWPGVSILKPLAGIDLNLEINLLSFFNMNYPNYELIFCVSDIDDPVCDIVNNLINNHLHVDARLVLATEVIGVNPKIQNLQAGYDIAKYDLILISDSSLWMRPDTLTDMVIALESEPDVGLVHQVPYMKPFTDLFQLPSDSKSKGNLPFHSEKLYNCNSEFKQQCGISNYFSDDCKQPSFTWVVQLVFFSCWHAKMYLMAALLRICCVTGMSCLLRRKVLHDSGGFKRFSCYLAEDFFISKYVHNRGWKIRLSHQPAWQNSPSPRLHQFYLRILRWSQLRMSMVFIAFLLEPFTRCFPNAILGAFSFSYILPDTIDSGVYFLCYVLFWFLLDYILMRQVYPPSTPTCITKLEYLVAWLFSELLAFPVHLSAMFVREVSWRNKRFRLHRGGMCERIVEDIQKSKKTSPKVDLMV